jgi:hypothetical protein
MPLGRKLNRKKYFGEGFGIENISLQSHLLEFTVDLQQIKPKS